MTLLPIQFRTKLKKEEFGELSSSESLDIIQNYLNEKSFNYIKRKKNKIIFHKLNGFSLLNTKSFLVSGVIKTKVKNKELIIINGNWMVLLYSLPFLFFILIAESKFSTLEKSNLEIIWAAFIILFGGNLIIRIIAHLDFSITIKRIIKKTIPNNV
ncbi:MAG: hypothetical protein ACI9SJ_000550 [Flavobacteriaceae bacterium]|jgi:hypothetical protein|uniref:hypothetical protein n=1 Tax=Candidatus Marifrigoribacter sp. Uisw_064 TaxID=3230970 RepID=UPI003AE2B00D